MHEGHQDIATDALTRPHSHGRRRRDHATGDHRHPHDHSHEAHGHSHAHGGPHAHPGAAAAPAEITIRLPAWVTDLRAHYRAFMLPALLTLLTLLSWQGALNVLLGFDVAIIAVGLGLAVIGWQTVQEVRRARRITAGVLVTIALVATVIVEHYRAGAIVAIMMLLGEALESMTLGRTREAIRKLMDLTPPMARVKHTDHTHDVPVEQVSVGDLVLVYAGERVPVDGLIAAGHSALDQSPITGESLPADKGPGDKVFSGTINLSGPLEVRATAVGQSSTVGKIIEVVRRALSQKGPQQRIADRFAGWFTPTVLFIATVVFAATGDVLRAVAVLVIACPCALVLATPTAVVASVGNAARRGALIKGGVTLEKMATVDTVILDKTGTVTLGKPRVAAVMPFDGRDAQWVLTLATTLERFSRHPLAQAIVEAGNSNDEAEVAGSIQEAEATDVREVPGRGMVGTVSGTRIVVGTSRLLEENGFRLLEGHTRAARDVEAKGLTGVWVAEGDQIAGLVALGDTVRPEAAQLVRDLKTLGVRDVVMLTGDNRAAAEHVAHQLGVDRVLAEVLPDEKAEVVGRLMRDGRRVAMVGDGINDAPALALAHVGVAMGAAGSDIAIDTADIALLGDRLEVVPEVVRLSRRAYRVIRQNIFLFALAANIGGIVLASAGMLSPIGAALVHNASSVFVVTNSARLLGGRRPSRSVA